jgi:hypothetical protein
MLLLPKLIAALHSISELALCEVGDQWAWFDATSAVQLNSKSIWSIRLKLDGS